MSAFHFFPRDYQTYNHVIEHSNDNSTCPSKPETAPLHWWNVALASIFIFFNGGLSLLFGLRLESSLFISSIRCIIQLTIMGLVLEDVFASQNPIFIMGLVGLLIFLGANEIFFNKSKRRHAGMFLSSLLSLGLSTLIIGIIGTRFAMSQDPFWSPQQFIPTMGMLLGNCMSGIAVGVSYCLSQLSEQKERIETFLSYGASRWEAGRPIAIEAIRLAMLPTINNMGVVGLISIPGMMTGQIIGGQPIMDAVKYQQIIMFMISASTSLGVLSAVIICILTVLDSSHRLRQDLITDKQPWNWAFFTTLQTEFVHITGNIFTTIRDAFCCFAKSSTKDA
ncbi:7695_t:CDS:10 [Ambispora gerdemannii]|uniref:7695_t:CDS:1 n=1 Tax=Ambispora gerdemannii TaxID=144530 RepID=A0A9N9AMV9_9GLOM|nr:7695_t:CDS:10 [Ambispora gerdemannii]